MMSERYTFVRSTKVHVSSAKTHKHPNYYKHIQVRKITREESDDSEADHILEWDLWV